MIDSMNSNYFKEIVTNKDYIRLKTYMVSLIHDDPTFESGEYEKAEKYLLDNGLGDIYQQYTKVPGEPGNKDKSQWDEKYFSDRSFALLENFSRERLAHVKEVGKYVYRDKPTPGKEEAAKKAQAAQTQPKTSAQKTSMKSGSPTNLKKLIPILLVVLALIIIAVIIAVVIKKKS